MSDQASQSPRPSGTDTVALHSLTVGERAAGDGSSDAPAELVFLHGLFGQGRNFTTVAKALAPGAVSELIDLPNHGRSDWSQDVGYVATADAVAEHLRARNPNRLPVHLIGHSMGGKVAMVLALRHPDLVDRLVVVDIAPAASNGVGEFEHLLDSLARLDLDQVERRADADRLLSDDIRSVAVRSFLLQNLRGEKQNWRWQANLDLLRARLDEIGGWPSIEGGFEGPVLWVAGEKSDYILPEHDAAMRRLFPRSVKVSVKGAGHWVHSEQPDRFIATLRSFLLT